MIIEKIIPRNVIINRGAAEVDNHISRDDFFDYHPLKNVIFILLYRIFFLIFFYQFFLLTWFGKFQGQHNAHLLRMDHHDIFHKRVVFVNSFSVRAGHDRRAA